MNLYGFICTVQLQSSVTPAGIVTFTKHHVFISVQGKTVEVVCTHLFENVFKISIV